MIFNKDKGRDYFDSVYKNCIMVYAKDLAVGDTLRHGGVVESVNVFTTTKKVIFSVKGNNTEVTLDIMVNIKTD